MDCHEAQQLLDQGVTPKSYPPKKAELGFHLAQCATCRAYQHKCNAFVEQFIHHEQGNTAEYTAHVVQPTQTEPLPFTNATNYHQQGQYCGNTAIHRLRTHLPTLSVIQILWVFSIFLFVIVPLGGAIWLGAVLVRTHYNVSAMIVTSVPVSQPQPTPLLTLSMSTDTPTPFINNATIGTSGGDGNTLSMAMLTPFAPPTTSTLIPQNEHQANHTKNNSQHHAKQTTISLPSAVWWTTHTQPSQRDTFATPTPWPTIQSLLPTQAATPIRIADVHVPPMPPLPPPTYDPYVSGAEPQRMPAPSVVQSVPIQSPLNTAHSAPPAGGAVTVLLLGSDRRPNETEPTRTDAVMLLRADPIHQRVALLSLPRDLWVTIPGYGANRINAAFVWGETYQAPGGGLALTTQTVSELLGTPIDYTILVDFQGFIGLIDSLGGITVDVEKELYDDSFPTMDYGYMEAHFLPGKTPMDGKTALIYSRIRHPDSDFMRIRRQQAVIVGIAERLRERGDVLNLLTLDSITAALTGYVQTNMPEDRIIGLVWALHDYKSNAVEHYAVEPEMVYWGVGNDRYALVLPESYITQLVAKFLGNTAGAVGP